MLLPSRGSHPLLALRLTVAAEGVGHEVNQFSPVCTYCNQAMGFRSCDAFGKGRIPLPIWEGQNDHTRPYPGDNGTRFERGIPRFLRERTGR